MSTIKLSAQELRGIGFPYESFEDDVEVIERNLLYNTRWSLHYELIFKWKDGKYYRAEYSEGANELQNEDPWEYQDYVECVEVHKVPRMVEVWEPVE